MSSSNHKVVSVAAGVLWSLVGLVAGLFLGFSSGLPFRLTVFLAALGLAVGWFGFTGTYGRLNGKGNGHSALLPAPDIKALPEPPKPAPPAPFRAEDHIFSPNEAREWLDDFLVRQQRGK